MEYTTKRPGKKPFRIMLQAKTWFLPKVGESVRRVLLPGSSKLRKLEAKDPKLRNDELERRDTTLTPKRTSTPNNDAEQASTPQSAQALIEKPLPERPFHEVAGIYELDAHQDGAGVSDLERSQDFVRVVSSSENPAEGHSVLHLEPVVSKAIAHVLRAHCEWQRARADVEPKQRANDKFIARLHTQIARHEEKLENMERFQSVRNDCEKSESRDFTTDILELQAGLIELMRTLASATSRREEVNASLEKRAQLLRASQVEVKALFERVLVGAGLLEETEVSPPRQVRECDVHVEYKALLKQYGIGWDEEKDGIASARRGANRDARPQSMWVPRSDAW